MERRTAILFFTLCNTVIRSGAMPKSELDDYETGYRRSDLFLQSPFFLGQPPSVLDPIGDILPIGGSHNTNNFLDIDMKGVGTDDNNDGDDTGLTWPGHASIMKLNNQGNDVIEAYGANFKKRMQETKTITDSPVSTNLDVKMKACDMHTNQRCKRLKTLVKKSKCQLDCILDKNEQLEDVSILSKVMMRTMKSYCQTSNTFFTKIRARSLNITGIDDFKDALTKLNKPMTSVSKGSLNGALANMINGVNSALSPIKSLMSMFGTQLKKTIRPLGIKGRILIDKNPGCAMINMNKPINKVAELVSKDPSITDHLVFQGYALFTSVTKYLNTFPSKTVFAVVQEGMSMMIGTSCGIFSFGRSGKTSNCDQFGRFPVLNMPIPASMWTERTQNACENVRTKVMLSGGKNGENPGPALAVVKKSRRRRSMTVGVK